jgi:hypothetical protein
VLSKAVHRGVATQDPRVEVEVQLPGTGNEFTEGAEAKHDLYYYMIHSRPIFN